MTTDITANNHYKHRPATSQLKLHYERRKAEYMEYADRYHIQIRVDEYAIYFKTSVCLWMATFNTSTNKFVLLHANNPYRAMSLEQAHIAKYHLQEDAKRSMNLCILMDYLRKHDNYAACIQTGGDTKKVYCSKHYRNVRKAMEYKAAAARLDDIFRRLETGAAFA